MNKVLLNKTFILVSSLIIPPVGLVLIWLRKGTLWKKIVITPILLFWSITLIALFIGKSMTPEEREKLRDKGIVEELEKQEDKRTTSFSSAFEKIDLLQMDSDYADLQKQLKQSETYQRIMNQEYSLELLQVMSAVADIQNNLTSQVKDYDTGALLFKSSVNPEVKKDVYSNENHKIFLHLLVRFLEHGSYPKEIVIALDRYAIKYGYYGGPISERSPKGTNFRYCFVQTILEYSPNNEEYLDIMCEGINDGYIDLDNIDNHVFFRFTNGVSFNKHLKRVYPESECYIDADKNIKEFKKDCMNEWYGSCTNLQVYVKSNMMKNPDSFEHIQTTYYDQGNYALVIMKFRGKNALGISVIDVVKAKVSWDCEVLSILRN